jgi:hypothetical protein
MLYHLTRDCFSGEGAIVDCGAFLGKSAALLAEGLLDNPRLDSSLRSRRIHSYDWFRVCDDHDVWFIQSVVGAKMQVGDATRQLFDQQTAPWTDLIEVHEGDFLEAAWEGGSIELLFLDICKSAELNARVLEIMFPSLLPTRAIVVQQDYHHAHHPAIHVSLELLAEYVQPLASRIDDSFVFRLTRQIPQGELAKAANAQRLPRERQLELIDAAVARLPADERHFVSLARVVLILQLYGAESASAALERLPRPPIDQNKTKWEHELAQVRQRIATGR